MLIERDESLARLAAALADVTARGEGRLLFVGGEAGVGKTALLRELCAAQRGPAGGAPRVLWGACEPLRTPRPLGPLSDVAEATGGELRELVERGARPHEVAMALIRELRGHSAVTVLVLEDLHWADEATLDVVTLLASRIAVAPALTLASYREDELDRAAQLRFVLGEVARRPNRVRLDALSPGGVAELAAQHDVDAAELHDRTGGNPFFVTEVLAAGGDEIPDTVRDAVLARATRLSEPARRVLEAVAIVPGPATPPLLETLAGDGIDHLDECLASGMLAAAPAHVEFRHELARQAIEDATPPHRRLALHQRALVALAEHAEPARLAHHADAAGDTRAVLRYAPQAAARAAASGAHREAAAQYARALKYATELPPAERAELLKRRAEECYLSADFDSAIAAQREALECHRELRDSRGEGDSLRSLSRLLFFAGRTGEGEPVALQAVRILERLPPGRELAMAYGNVAQRRSAEEDRAAAVEWGERGLRLATELDDTEAYVYALTNIGGAEFQADRPEGRHKLEDALRLAREHGLHEYVGRAHLQLVLCAQRNRRYDVAAPYLEAGIAYCEEHGLDTWRAYLQTRGACQALDRGDWDTAAEVAATVLRDPRAPGLARGWALTTRGRVRVRRGDAESEAPLAEAHELARGSGELMRIVPVAAARAELAWLSGDDAAVEGLTGSALQLAIERGSPWAADELAYWRRQAGAPHDAAAAERFRTAASDCPYEAALMQAESVDEDTVRAAIETLQAMGARPAARIISRRLRERGVRRLPRGPQPRTRENPAGLTARELEVLALLAEGMRNAQIAQKLIVSEKTVNHHVSAVLRKLDVSTRGEAGAKATRLGLVR